MIDTSFLLGPAPVALLTPDQIQFKKLQIQNALATGQLNQQALQSGALDLQQRQQAAAADARFRALYAPQQPAGAAPVANALASSVAPPPSVMTDPATGQALGSAPAYTPGPANALAAGAAPPAAAPPTRAHDVSDEDILNIYGEKGLGVIKARNDSRKVLAESQKTQGEVEVHNRNYWGAIASGLQGVNYDPRAVQGAISQAQADGMGSTPQFAQLVQTAQSNPGALPQLGQIAIAQSEEQQKALSERTTATAHASQAKTTADKFAADLPGIQSENQIKALTAAGNAPIQPAEAKRIALEAASQAESRRHNRVEESNAAARLNQDVGNPLEGVSAGDMLRLKAIANGDIPAPSARSVGYKKTMDQVLSLDPTYTESRYIGIKNFKTSGDADKLVSITTALGHLENAQANSAALGTSPLQSLNITPAQRRYHADADLLTQEVGRLVKSGVITDSESNRLLGNVTSMWQPNRDAGLDELKNLMGGKFDGISQKYKNATGRTLPVSMFDQPTQQRLARQGLIGAPAGTSAPAKAVAAAYTATATGPDGHKIGSPDGGQTWFDVQTGKRVQ